jgi:hypothetical protein
MSLNLIERLGTEPVRTKVIDDCVALIDNQVRGKGLVIRTAYGTVKALKKNFVREVVDTLLNDWMGKLQPHHDKWTAGGASGSFADYLIARSDDVAENLLAVTDVRAERTSHATAKKLYTKMRPSAKSNVIDAVPELARLVERHINESKAA